MQINEFLKAYAAARLKPEDRASASRVNMLLRFFEGRDVLELRSNTLREEYVSLRRETSAAKRRPITDAALRRELGVVMAASNWAHRQRMIVADDIPRWELPPSAPPREHWMTREDAALLLTAAQPKALPMLTRAFLAISLMLYTGARKEAAQELTWDRIHLNKSENGNGYIDLRNPAKPQTRKRRAVVPIFDEFAPIVERAQREATSPYFLFHSGNCAPTIATVFRRAGLDGKYKTKRDQCHLLRKTCATWAAQDDVPMGQIAALLGDTIQTTEKHYAMHSPSYMQKIARRSVLGDVLQ